MNSNSSWKPTSPLAKQVMRGGMWLFALHFSGLTLGFARLVILARLLMPEDFGLMGMALLTIGTFNTFFQTGFMAALIQKKEIGESHLNSAWTIRILKGFILFAILYFVSPYASLFLKAPEAEPMIQVLGLTVLLDAFTNIGIIYFQKELEFKKEFFFRFSGLFTNFVVAVSAAFILKNAWALVISSLCAGLVWLFMSYILHPFRPRPVIDLEKTKGLFSFGKWAFGSNILVFLINKGDDVFVGKFLGAASLGFYQMAFRVSNTPTTEVSHVVSQVTFPAYSKLQDNMNGLREAYLRVLRVTAFLSVLLAGFIMVLGPDFTRLFLGEKWIPMIPAMQVLVFAGLVRSFQSTTGPLFYASGKPSIDTKWQLLRLLILFGLIYPFTIKWGIMGTSVAVLLSIFISSIGFIFQATDVIKSGLNDIKAAIGLPLINAAIMVLCLFAIKAHADTIGIQFFLLLIIMGLCIYLGLFCFFYRSANTTGQSFIRESFSTLIGNLYGK